MNFANRCQREDEGRDWERGGEEMETGGRGRERETRREEGWKAR